MVLDVALPASLELDDLRSRIAALASEVGVEASIRVADADVL
jgi:hypothetical protein